ncbi:MAG: hypothetical protein AAF960_07285 [Bacteroidota bacterium]
MKKVVIITATIVASLLIINRQQLAAVFNANEADNHPPLVEVVDIPAENELAHPSGDYLVNDSLYKWDNLNFDWVTVNPAERTPRPTFTTFASTVDFGKPIKIDWNLLMEIEYNLKYYQEFEMKIYAPVFTQNLIALDGKEVLIEGFVIPLDEEGDLVALSANPFASCFFCGKASPASVMSLYLKKKKLYKMDDYRKFKGRLRLNYNDPEEYYYILEDAVPK